MKILLIILCAINFYSLSIEKEEKDPKNLNVIQVLVHIENLINDSDSKEEETNLVEDLANLVSDLTQIAPEIVEMFSEVSSEESNTEQDA